MSDPENFIARWSRRKRAAAEHADEKKTSKHKPAAVSEGTDESAPRAGTTVQSDAPPPELPFDLAKLPPLESITAESDIRAFLAPGVPAELTRAALRRAWSADPKIREFVGLADYDWDFNAPGAIAGFGPLEMTDEMRRQIVQMVGRSLTPEAPEQPAPTPSEPAGEQVLVEAPDNSTESAATTSAAPVRQVPSNAETSQDKIQRSDVVWHNLVQREQNNTASQYRTEKPDNVQLIDKRPHGRALPK
jgi:Protein of unknown function (DUF3306)